MVLKQYGVSAVNAVSKVRKASNFFDYLVIIRHYFTGDGKVSCILYYHIRLIS